MATTAATRPDPWVPTKHDSLAAALVAAQREARAVEKDARNEHHKYAYASAEAVITEARMALTNNGLCVMQSGWNLTSEDVEYTNDDGVLLKDQERTLHVKFVLLHEGGQQVDSEVQVPVIPERGRPVDKATFSALTYAESYYLRGLLCLARTNASDDIDQRDDRDWQPRRNAARPAAAPATQPGERSGPANSFPGPCDSCGAEVAAGAGVREKRDGKWIVLHRAETDCAGPAPPAPDPQPDSERTPPPADSPARASNGRARKNDHPGPCRSCGVNVPAKSGITYQGLDKKWVVEHESRAYCTRAKSAQASLPTDKPTEMEIPKGCAWSTADATCIGCDEIVLAGKGFTSSKSGKTKCIRCASA